MLITKEGYHVIDSIVTSYISVSVLSASGIVIAVVVAENPTELRTALPVAVRTSS